MSATEQEFLDYVASEGLGYALSCGCSPEGIKDKKIRKLALEVQEKFQELESWVEKHPNYSPM